MTTPYWLINGTTGQLDISTDVLVVGGGYVGLSTAFWLTELRPDLKITVLDRSHCGAGASGRNAGFLTIGSASFYKGLCERWGLEKAKKVQSFARESLELLHRNILNKSNELEFERTGSLTLFQSPHQLEKWEKDQFNPHDFDFVWQERGLLPLALQPKFYGALAAGPEFKIDPMKLIRILKKNLESRNVQMVEGTSAFEVTHEGVKTEANLIRAKQIVLAMNGYFPQFHQTFKNSITPMRAQMLAVEFKGSLDCPHLYYDPPQRVYWRKTEAQVMIIGGKRLLDENGEVGDFDKNSPLIQDGLEIYLKEQLGLNYRVLRRWSGTMGFTEHELPLVGRVDAPIETYMIGGFSGHGMGLGFRSGLDAAELILGIKKESFFSQFKNMSFKI